jgi:GH15 family glucan-1,4-alpha-glucosidase
VCVLTYLPYIKETNSEDQDTLENLEMCAEEIDSGRGFGGTLEELLEREVVENNKEEELVMQSRDERLHQYEGEEEIESMGIILNNYNKIIEGVSDEITTECEEELANIPPTEPTSTEASKYSRWQLQCKKLVGEVIVAKILKHNKPFVKTATTTITSTTTITTTYPILSTITTTTPTIINPLSINFILNNDNNDMNNNNNNTNNNEEEQIIFCTNRRGEGYHARGKFAQYKCPTKCDIVIESEIRIAESPEYTDIVATAARQDHKYCESVQKSMTGA